MANRTPRDASQAAVAAARAIRTQREEQGRNARQLLYRPTAFPTLQEQDKPFPCRSRASLDKTPYAAEGRKPPHWASFQHSMREKFPEGFNPPKKLSREAMQIVRQLHQADPSIHTTPALAARYKVSPESIRRILKSKWRPSQGRLDQESIKLSREKTEVLDAESSELEQLASKWRLQQSDTR